MAQPPVIQAPSLLLAEAEGDLPLSVELTLLGRSLPREVEFGGEHRESTTWYPGFHAASVQNLGPKEGPMPLEGLFDDRYLRLEKKWASTANDEGVALRIVDQLEQMRVRARLCKYVWGPIVKFGHLRKTKFRVLDQGRVKYELEFHPTGSPDDTFQINEKVHFPDLLTALDGILGVIANVVAGLNAAAGAFNAITDTLANAVQAVLDVVDSLVSAVNSVVNAATGFVQGIVDTTDNVVNSVRRVIGIVGNLRSSAAALGNSVRSLEADVGMAGSEAKSAVDAEELFFVVPLRYTLSSSARTLGAMAYDIQRELSGAQQAVALHLVKDGETLQAIARRYSGSALNWRAIAAANKLATSKVDGGQVVRVPTGLQRG